MLKVFYWNCRGIANCPTQRVLANMIIQHSPDLLFLYEPTTSFFASISYSWYRLGFDTLHSNDSPFPSTTSNLRCFSKSSHPLSTTVIDSSSQHLSILLHNSSIGLNSTITAVYSSTNPSLRKELWAVLTDYSSTVQLWCSNCHLIPCWQAQYSSSYSLLPQIFPICCDSSRPPWNSFCWKQVNLVKQ